MNDMFQEILSPLVSVAVAITTPVVVTVAVQFFRKLGIDIEAKNREALQSALHNAATVAVSKAGIGRPRAMKEVMDEMSTAAKDTMAGNAVDYVKESVPGAVKKFGLDRNKIKKLLEPHLAKAVNTVEK